MILSICLSRTETSQSPLGPKLDLLQTYRYTDAFIVFASIYVRAHPDVSISLFKYLNVIRLRASRVGSLAWRNYKIQFRMKKEYN